MGLKLKKAGPEDMSLLFSWVNDPETRKNSFDQHLITMEEHKAWYEKKLADETCIIYIAYDGALPVGQVRLDITGTDAEIDYSVAPAFRGRGYGKQLLMAVQKEENAFISRFVAYVKPDNVRSLTVFQKTGFWRTESTPEAIRMVKGREPRRIVVCTHKSWNEENAGKLKALYGESLELTLFTSKEDLQPDKLDALNPEYIFFPHWSYIIPDAIYENYECVVFHMTDLPYGRGGSPLQNLILQGKTDTKISAIRVNQGLDTGDIYGKAELSLEGSAGEILKRCSDVIFQEMIPWMLLERPVPKPQEGEAVTFARRKPEQSILLPEFDEKRIYDQIRMLDGEGYPPAFLEFGDYRLEFSRANLGEDGLSARVVFRKQEK